MASVPSLDSQYQWGSWLWTASPSITKCSGWSSWYYATGLLPTCSAFPQVQSKYSSRTVWTSSQSKARVRAWNPATNWLLSSVYRPSLSIGLNQFKRMARVLGLSLHCVSLPFQSIFSLILVDRKSTVSLPWGQSVSLQGWWRVYGT